MIVQLWMITPSKDKYVSRRIPIEVACNIIASNRKLDGITSTKSEWCMINEDDVQMGCTDGFLDPPQSFLEWENGL